MRRVSGSRSFLRDRMPWLVCVLAIVVASTCMVLSFAGGEHDSGDARRLNPEAPTADPGFAPEAGQAASHHVRGRPARLAGDYPALPHENTPWPDLYEELRDRVDHGDGRAAIRLYNDSIRCIEFSGADQRVRGMLKMTRRRLAEYDAGNEKRALLEERGLAKIQQILDSDAGLCSGVDPGALEAALPEVILQAARAGDENAAACYASDAFPRMPVDEVDASEVESYRANAEKFIRDGVATGDWRMVLIMASACDGRMPGDSSSPLKHLVPADPLQSYAWHRLLSLGALGDLKSYAAGEAQRVRDSGRYSVEELENADTWARATFERSFSGKPPPADVVAYCSPD